GQDTVSKMKDVKFSGNTKNRYKEKISFKNRTIKVENIQFIPSATRTIVEDKNGSAIISMIVLEHQNRQELILEKGEVKNFNGIVFSFDNPSEFTTILISEGSSGLVINALKGELSAGKMGSERTTLPLGEEFPLNQEIIYQIGHTSFALKQYIANGSTRLIHNPENKGRVHDAFRAKITVDGETKIINVFGLKGLAGQPSSTTVNNLNVSVTYGSVLTKLPFSLFLKDFDLERYPGSHSPSSFASDVVLIDKIANTEMPFRIFMNNILKYKGYRFFQSSYDQDEKGTILSVNYDSWGTTITYLGYFLMIAGMVFSLFNRNSRFRKLIKASTKLKAQRSKILVLFLFLGISGISNAQAPSPTGTIDKTHAREFGKLLIQSNEGRIEPVNSVASEILRKVYKKNSFEGLSPVEVFLGRNADPQKWRGVKLIKVSRPEIKMMLGITGDYASFDDLMTGGYKLSKLVEQAYGKKSAARNKSDKEIIKIDERVNICYLVLSGEMLKIFPIPDETNNSWIFLKNSEHKLPTENREFATRTLSDYFAAVNSAKHSGDWSSANNLLIKLKSNQLIYGSAVVPSQTKINLEIFYINYNIFGRLAKFYLIVGLILLLVVFISIFKPEVKLKKVIDIGTILVFILFFLHTLGLGLRWYISGHAPWSNGYESMIFISWATCLSGLIFAKRSQMALAVTTVLSALTLLIAGLSWMSPEITNLVPVLKSYWLIVHVAIVTASYGFLGIGALLGFTNLLLILLRNKKNKGQISYTIKELEYIIQIALIIGLYMLTIGSFIGGIWANESWGRYWGWDPKETWALVTVLVYSFIVHMHKIPGFKGYFALSTAALLGFSSVLMTYFGVNYYLSGLHSYASGDSVPIPAGVYIAVVVILIVVVSAFITKRNYGDATEPDLLPPDND
ncbi:MAG: cytochrome c biogenesis protein CcsA, partial [Draconibacterium sp.]|nr:cytochrome c biogenesis protein CcsA [Draconibacterium sp.]